MAGPTQDIANLDKTNVSALTLFPFDVTAIRFIVATRLSVLESFCLSTLLGALLKTKRIVEFHKGEKMVTDTRATLLHLPCVALASIESSKSISGSV